MVGARRRPVLRRSRSWPRQPAPRARSRSAPHRRPRTQSRVRGAGHRTGRRARHQNAARRRQCGCRSWSQCAPPRRRADPSPSFERRAAVIFSMGRTAWQRWSRSVALTESRRHAEILLETSLTPRHVMNYWPRIPYPVALQRPSRCGRSSRRSGPLYRRRPPADPRLASHPASPAFGSISIEARFAAVAAADELRAHADCVPARRRSGQPSAKRRSHEVAHRRASGGRERAGCAAAPGPRARCNDTRGRDAERVQLR